MADTLSLELDMAAVEKNTVERLENTSVVLVVQGIVGDVVELNRPKLLLALLSKHFYGQDGSRLPPYRPQNNNKI